MNPLRPFPKVCPALALVAAVIIAAAALYTVAFGILIKASNERTPARAAFLATATDDALTRLDHMPSAIGTDPRIAAVLAGGDPADLNRHLAGLATRAGAEVIYLMDMTGETLAASNHDRSDSFVGQNYAFRPYFSAAVAGGTGRFFAVGVTTGRPGYFVADPVRGANGTIIGVLVVKLGLERLTDAWSNADDTVMITSSDGIVIAASNPAWRYHTLAPLTAAQLERTQSQRQFDGAPLDPLDLHQTGDRRIRLNRRDYLQTTAAIPRENWTLHLLNDVRALQLQALWVVAIAVAALLTLIGLATVWRSARLRRALAVSVADRKRLTREIEDRRKAEQDLKAAQGELARAGRLAALGQLSASITHELGQPISAMRNYIAAAEISQPALQGGLFDPLNGLVARMQSITEQLRFFATPARRPSTGVDMVDVVNAAVDLVAHDLVAADVTLVHQRPDAPMMVRGVAHRLEQVFVNLLRNAQQAMAQTPAPAITISYDRQDGQITVQVADNGPGIAELTLDDMQEPFMTTKSSGTGMGLGLAICAQIIKDHAGQMQTANAKGGGAVFGVQLPEDQGPA